MNVLTNTVMAVALSISSTLVNAEVPTKKTVDELEQRENPSLIRGEIKYINEKAEKITIKHEEIKILNMQPMTMVFRVREKAMLNQFKVGDLVNFSARKIDGVVVILKLEHE